MKGGGEKQGRSSGRSPPLQPESERFRRVSVVLGCFLFVLVFLLSSSSHDVALLNTLSTKPKDAAETLRSSAGHEVRDTTTAAVATNDVVREAQPEGSHAAAAATSNSDGRAAPGAADEPVRDTGAVHATTAATAVQPAVETTSPRHKLPDSVDQRRPPLCDFSGFRADTCDLAGDVRLDAKAATLVVVDDDDPAGGGGANVTTAYKVRPYPRKGDATAMGRVTEVTVRTASASGAPTCTRTHAAPAVVFSAGGYAGNLFHDFTDVIVPLYTTAAAARFRGGDVRLVVADAVPRWLARYAALLRALSRHAPIDLAAAAAAREVHCFPRAVVTPRAHRELLIERGGDGGPTMPDFSQFLRRAFALPRDAPTRPVAGTKPRLLVIARRGTRRILNVGAVARAAEEVGFEAVVSDLDGGGDDGVAAVARLVNAFDAVVGVHGAGLTNMVFLPPGAAVVEVVPWGGLRWIARLDFGDPAEAMGLRYAQYEVAVEESTLKDKFPRDHQVFTNPTALHKKGFTFLRRTFLNGQDIIVDVERFKPVLVQALRNLAQ